MNNIIKPITSFVKSNSSPLMMGVGVALMIEGTIDGIRHTPQALELIEKRKKELGVEKLGRIETIKTTWKCYTATVLESLGGATCIFISGKRLTRQNAVLATALGLSDTTLKEYQAKVEEVLGEKKAASINESIAQDKVIKDPPPAEVPVSRKGGNTLCRDGLFGGYCRADIEMIRRAVNRLNDILNRGSDVSLNDFYEEVGIDTIHPLGDDLIWQSGDGLIDLTYTSCLTSDNEPVLVFNYGHCPPRHAY